MLGLSSFVKGVLFIKTVQETCEEQVARGGKRGKGRCIKDPEFYFEHINFMLPVCCPKGSKSVRCSHKPLYSGSKEHSLWSQNVNLTAF